MTAAHFWNDVAIAFFSFWYIRCYTVFTRALILIECIKRRSLYQKVKTHFTSFDHH